MKGSTKTFIWFILMGIACLVMICGNFFFNDYTDNSIIISWFIITALISFIMLIGFIISLWKN